MKKIPDIITTTFSTRFDGFFVDIVESTDTLPYGEKEEMYHAWLYHKDYGLKHYCYGAMKKDFNSIEEFINMIDATLKDDVDVFYELINE